MNNRINKNHECIYIYERIGKLTISTCLLFKLISITYYLYIYNTIISMNIYIYIYIYIYTLMEKYGYLSF